MTSCDRAAEGCDNIQFLGYQSGDRLDALYRNAVAVVVPSINYEVAPPLVIMEAFLRRTPHSSEDLARCLKASRTAAEGLSTVRTRICWRTCGASWSTPLFGTSSAIEGTGHTGRSGRLRRTRAVLGAIERIAQTKRPGKTA